MVYYVIYRPPYDFEDRARIEENLENLGCRQIHPSIWTIDKERLLKAEKILERHSPTFLKRTREIMRPCFSKDGGQKEIGSLIIIACQISGIANKRKFRKYLRRTPYIRLNSCVYAFPQKYFSDKSGRLLNAGSFWEYALKFDSNALILSRLVIVNSTAIDRLLKETEIRMKNETKKIIGRCKSLTEKVENNEIDRTNAIKIIRTLEIRFAIIKKVYEVYEEWLKLNLSSFVIKPYSAMRKARSAIERYGVIY
ncbi:MAG: hypothetical protein QW279_15270 [Candidatus Jordarchaeaceae archaeon]